MCILLSTFGSLKGIFCKFFLTLMENSKLPRICVTVILVVMLLQLVLTRPFIIRSLSDRPKKQVSIRASDDVSKNIRKATEATELTIFGEKKECTLREIKNVIQVLRNLGENRLMAITLQNLDLPDKNANEIKRRKIQQNDNRTTLFVRQYQFLGVSPRAMLLILKQFSFVIPLKLEIETACNDISGILAEIKCDTIEELVIRNLTQTKKYNDLKYNRKADAKNRWIIEKLILERKDTMKIPTWILQRVTISITLSLKHYFFLPENALQKLFAEELIITNAEGMEQFELKAEQAKRKIKKFRRTSQQKVLIIFNVEKNRKKDMVFNRTYASSILYYFAPLFSKVDSLIMDFIVDPTDLTMKNAISNWSDNILPLQHTTQPESVKITITKKVDKKEGQ